MRHPAPPPSCVPSNGRPRRICRWRRENPHASKICPSRKAIAHSRNYWLDHVSELIAVLRHGRCQTSPRYRPFPLVVFYGARLGSVDQCATCHHDVDDNRHCGKSHCIWCTPRYVLELDPDEWDPGSLCRGLCPLTPSPLARSDPSTTPT